MKLGIGVTNMEVDFRSLIAWDRGWKEYVFKRRPTMGHLGGSVKHPNLAQVTIS